jgi:pyridoxal phosphate enzyme (YggS family)
MSLHESQIAERIRANLAEVNGRIAAAAARAGRSGEEVLLVGVTKYVEPRIARLLYEAGLHDLGESRPQELWSKAELLADLSVKWHLIGHLQRNKVRRTLPLVAWIHSVDSLRLLREIDSEAGALHRSVDVLLEVNVSGDVAKHGLPPDDVEPLFPEITLLKNVKVRGLMTMAALEGGVDRARRDFAALRELADRLRPNCACNIVMNELSMGMSGDYEVAIEEGATIVRVGSALFEGIEA